MPLVVGIAAAGFALVMLKRKIHVELPNFFRYIVLMALQLITLYVLCNFGDSEKAYFYAYWISVFGMSIMSFFVLYEVFVRILKPYSAVIDLARMMFSWAGAFLLMVAALAALAMTGSGQDRLEAAMSLINRSLLLMECGLLTLLLVFEKRLGISWHSRSAMIALGFGTSAATELLTSFLRTRFNSFFLQFDLLNGAVFLGFIVYWAVRMPLPEPQRKNVLDSPSRLIFQRWNEVLMSTPIAAAHGNQLAMAEVDSFIPGVEKTVERIMARKMSVN